MAMFRRRLGWALGASLVSGASALCVARSRPATVPLASTVCQPLLPTTVLVHGLEGAGQGHAEPGHGPAGEGPDPGQLLLEHIPHASANAVARLSRTAQITSQLAVNFAEAVEVTVSCNILCPATHFMQPVVVVPKDGGCKPAAGTRDTAAM